MYDLGVGGDLGSILSGISGPAGVIATVVGILFALYAYFHSKNRELLSKRLLRSALLLSFFGVCFLIGTTFFIIFEMHKSRTSIVQQNGPPVLFSQPTPDSRTCMLINNTPLLATGESHGTQIENLSEGEFVRVLTNNPQLPAYVQVQADGQIGYVDSRYLPCDQ